MSLSNASKIAKSSIWLTSSFIIAKISQLLGQLFLARLLSPEDFGIWGMVLLVITLSRLFKDQAIASVLIQRGVEDKVRVNAVYSLGITISMGMFIIQLIAGYPLSIFFDVPILFPLTGLTSLIFLIGAGAGTRGAILQCQMKFREIAICTVGAGVARLVGAVSCAALGGGVWSFAVAEIFAEVVHTILKRVLCTFPLSYQLFPDKEAVRDVRGFITSMVSINLAVYANTNIDNLIIGKLLGATSLGFYSVSYQLAMLPAFALSQINKINFSVLSKRDGHGQESYVRQMLELYAIGYSIIYGLGFVTAPWLIPTLYGSTWQNAVPLFQIVLVFAYARGFMSILGTALNAMDAAHINAFINWVLVPISVLAFYIGAVVGDVTGVAISSALVMGIGATIWFWITTCRTAGWNVFSMVKPVLIPTGSTIGSIMLAVALPTLDGWGVILSPIMMLIMYIILLSMFSKGRIPVMLIQIFRQVTNSSAGVNP
jgi:O-antigen/teichoic acid export membrane protein